MANSVHKKIEIVGTSPTSVEEAIDAALAASAGSVRNQEWFEVSEIRGRVSGGKVDQYQVTVKIGFKVEV